MSALSSLDSDVDGEMGAYLVKAALESTVSFRTVVPLLVDNAKGNVFIWWAGDKAYKASVILASWCK